MRKICLLALLLVQVEAHSSTKACMPEAPWIRWAAQWERYLSQCYREVCHARVGSKTNTSTWPYENGEDIAHRLNVPLFVLNELNRGYDLSNLGYGTLVWIPYLPRSGRCVDPMRWQEGHRHARKR